MLEVLCVVCENIFEKDLIVGRKLDEDNIVHRASDLICGNRCRKIYDETESNKSDTCLECGKKPKSEEIGVWSLNFKKRISNPTCKGCLYK